MTTVQECATNLDWQEVRIRSASTAGKQYTVSIPPWGGVEDITCDCPGYTFRGACRHTSAALERICNWTSEDRVPQTDEQRKNHICPRCGAGTVLTEE